MILASQSPRRIELMREAGYDIRIIPADIDETPRSGESPCELVARLARLKALHVAATDAAPGEVVVAADTIVTHDGTIMGKPADDEDAAAMLRDLSGRTHQVMTGVAIARGGETEPRENFITTTDVTFFELTDDEIAAYVATGEPADKAGAYGIQGAGGRLLVRGIAGDFYNVVGLPIAEVVRALAREGVARPSLDAAPRQ